MAILINCKDSVKGHIEVLNEHLENIVEKILRKGKDLGQTMNLAAVLYRDKSCKINRDTLSLKEWKVERQPEKLQEFIDDKCLFP